MPDLVVSIHFHDRDYSPYNNVEREFTVAKGLLRRIKVVTLFFRNCIINFSDNPSKFVNAVCSAAPDLKTLRFVMEHKKQYRFTTISKGNSDIDIDMVKRLSRRVLTPLHKTADLLLAQHCKAYRIRPGCSDRVPFSFYRVDILNIEMFVYERKVTTKNKWTPQELSEMLPQFLQTSPMTIFEEFSSSLGHAFSQEVKEKLSKYPFGGLEWKEMEVNGPKEW